MAILPVSSVNFNARSKVSFARKNNSEGAPADRGMTATLGKTVPVIVLMAPSLLNSAATKAFIPEEAPDYHVTSLVAGTQQEADEATYVIGADDLESMHNIKKAPYGWNLFLQDDIVEVNNGSNSLGNFDMVYTNNRIDDAGTISDVYILQKSREVPAESNFHPPRVYKLMYHNSGKFCGVVTKEDLLDDAGNYQGTLEREIKLDDNTAQKLIDLLTGHSKWKDHTSIRIYATNNNMLKPPKKY